MSPAKELPAWYHRVRALEEAAEEVGEDLDEDVFDEDLSDPEPDSDADDDTPVIRCDISDHDSDCGCPSPDASDDDVDEDDLSERSYDGPDAEDYYRLKYLREDRKRELIEIKEEQEELMEGDLQEEAIMVKKIQAAIKAVQKAEGRDAPAPFSSVANTTFHVYCVDYVKHCFCEWALRNTA